MRQTLDDAGAPRSPTGYAYTPFGVVRSGAEPAPFGFTGELHADDLVYLRARWYDPASGTLLGRDPFEGFARLPYSLHPYQYGYSDPVRYSDPSGELAIFVNGGWNIGSGKIAAAGEVPIFELGNLVAPLVGEKAHFYASDGSEQEIADLVVETYDRKCKGETSEPIALVGYSRGGATIQGAIDFATLKLPEVRIDLAVTIAPVHFRQPMIYHISHVRDSVARHVNIVSGQGVSANDSFAGDYSRWPPDFPGSSGWLRFLNESRMSGAHMEVIFDESHPDGHLTHHFGVMANEFVDKGGETVTGMPIFAWEDRPLAERTTIKVPRRERVYQGTVNPHPVWEIVKDEFRELSVSRK